MDGGEERKDLRKEGKRERRGGRGKAKAEIITRWGDNGWVCMAVESEQGNRREMDMVIRRLRIIQLKTIE